jgi:hypothetical protein
MASYRYYSEDELLPVATREQIEIIIKAIQSEQIEVAGTAKRHCGMVWHINISTFVEALRAHIESEHRIFQKYIKDPDKDTQFYDANVRLDPESEDEGHDVYIEIRIIGRLVVLICDAHNHPKNGRRLPK